MLLSNIQNSIRCNVETQITYYPLYYWAGTLIVPITIAIIAVIFYQYKTHIKKEIENEIEKRTILTNRRRKFRHIAEAAILTASCKVAANLLLSLNTDTHLLRFWAGILMIPITIVLLIVTYKDSVVAVLTSSGIVTTSLVILYYTLR